MSCSDPVALLERPPLHAQEMGIGEDARSPFKQRPHKDRKVLGIALLDPFTAQFFRRDEELVVRPFKDAPKYPFLLAQPRHHLDSRLQEDFIAEIEHRLKGFFSRRPRPNS